MGARSAPLRSCRRLSKMTLESVTLMQAAENLYRHARISLVCTFETSMVQLVSFVQQENQINQTNQTDQMNKTGMEIRDK